jgi:uncharacterized Zn finger protein
MAEHGLTLRAGRAETDSMYGAVFTGGFGLPGLRAPLATWLRDEAAALGQTARALAAAEVAFREESSLAAYLRAAELAGERWAELRPGLLDHLRGTKSFYPQGQIDVFLHEELIDDAVQTIRAETAPQLAARVADAALQAGAHLDWVIQTSLRQAEPIMDEGRAAHYDDAARWLARARHAYQRAGREADWRAYCDELLTRHARKYKLVPMLKALG